jgi:hypothetical protein
MPSESARLAGVVGRPYTAGFARAPMRGVLYSTPNDYYSETLDEDFVP